MLAFWFIYYMNEKYCSATSSSLFYDYEHHAALNSSSYVTDNIAIGEPFSIFGHPDCELLIVSIIF